jgi:hypothetical protein
MLSNITVTRIISVISFITKTSTIKGSGNYWDFMADRLRIATTESSLLGCVNRLIEVLGSPPLPNDLSQSLLRATSAPDAGICLQWLADQPKIAISIVASKEESELNLLITNLVASYEAKDRSKLSLAPRQGFDIRLSATVTQALSHGAEIKAGNATLFRRCGVKGGMQLPFYAGNAVGGQLRDLLADHFLQSLGLPLDKADPILAIWFFHILYSGGIMADGNIPKEFEKELVGSQAGAVKSSGVRTLRDMIPFFSVLGGVGKYPLEGYVYINDLRPECVEWGTGETPANQLITWRYLTRRDDFEGRDKKVNKKGEPKSDDDSTNDNTSMIVNTECLAEGTMLEGGIDVSRHISELELSVIAKGLELLKFDGYLGGKKHRGYGRVILEIDSELNLDSTVYSNYLRDNKQEILDYIDRIGGFKVARN